MKSTMTERLWESVEFQARQLAFDFGKVARVVVPIIKNMRAKMNEWLKKLPKSSSKPWKQMNLDLLMMQTAKSGYAPASHLPLFSRQIQGLESSF